MPAIRLAVLAVFVVALTGCIAEERGHDVKLRKGGYTGQADTPISAEARAKLNDRIAFQDYRGEMHQRLNPSQPPEASTAPVDGRISGQHY